MSVSACLNVMVKLGAFEQMKDQGSVTADELGAQVKVDPNVIGKSSRPSPDHFY